VDEVRSLERFTESGVSLAGITHTVSNLSGMPGKRSSDITFVRLFPYVESATC
jgi:hypothetical protein